MPIHNDEKNKMLIATHAKFIYDNYKKKNIII